MRCSAIAVDISGDAMTTRIIIVGKAGTISAQLAAIRTLGIVPTAKQGGR